MRPPPRARWWLDLLAGALGTATGLAVGADQIVRTAADSQALYERAVPTRLHFLAIRALSADLEDADALAVFRDTPYELSQEQIEALLVRSFSPGDVTLKAREIHAALVAYGSRHWEDSIPVFKVDIEAHHAVLADALSSHLVSTLEGLPDCGLVGDVDAILSGLEKKVGLADDVEALQDMPTCHPTELVAGPLRDGFQNGIVTRVVSHDSVDVLPRPDWNLAEYGETLALTRRIRLLPAVVAGAALLTFGAAVILALALGHRRTARIAVASGGIALSLIALALMLTPDGAGFEQLVLGRTLDPMSDIGDAWRALILEFGRGGLPVVSRRCALLAAIALSGFALLGWKPGAWALHPADSEPSPSTT